jgi:hypothetical protein
MVASSTSGHNSPGCKIASAVILNLAAVGGVVSLGSAAHLCALKLLRHGQPPLLPPAPGPGPGPGIAAPDNAC